MDCVVSSPLTGNAPTALLPEEQTSLGMASVLASSAQHQLVRMFRDPYVLKPEERTELVAQLRDAIALEPAIPELRVLLGMALCVNLEAQDAIEELREAVRIAPQNFAARLKFGELLMRLRICDQAAQQTHIAAELATNALQSELARKQAATIRTMQREGIERGSYGKVLSIFSRTRGLFVRTFRSRTSIAVTPR